ncbi:hypothetical protein E1B28_012777 [Marasmius oreades]|nr:uncharacterized protein E1B28_012777 [Marasmius oreades]KAG7088821.1 hypothetical protein E1B28_012777 [Marasmius oreades]
MNHKDFQQQHQQVDHNQTLSSSSQMQQGDYEDLTPEEAARRERVRAAARERQRKHRALVKQRKMRELGMDMGNQIVPNLEALQYPEAQYQLTQEMQQQGPPPGSVDPQAGEPAFPRIQGHGGQMFATTLLLSFSCAPLLKQHLLDTLQMSNEELASLEPIIADAWDQWDRQRRQFDPQSFEPNASSASSTTTTNSTASTSTSTSFAQLGPGATASETAAAAIAAVVTPDFRTRFHRSILAPSPFQAQAAAAAAQAGVSGARSPAPAIDPHLSENKDET